MEEDEDNSSYFLEVHDQIHSVDLVLRGSDHPKLIEIHPQSVVVKKHDGVLDVYPLVVSVEPNSFTSVQKHPNEGLGIRLQLRETTPEPQTNCLSTTVKRVGNEINRMECGACQCGCKTCGLTLFIDNVKFTRVLPLPSQTWRDLYDNWSCCSQNHGDEKGATPAYVTQASLKPREGDCLVDDFNILVHPKTIEKNNIIFRRSTKKASDKTPVLVQCVKCARCRAALGEVLITKDGKRVEAFKLNKNNIEVLSLRKHLSDSAVRPIFFSEFFLERLLAQQLANAVQTYATHLFVIQDTESNIYLLIRVMNTRSRLFVNNGKSSYEMPEINSEVMLTTMKTCDEENSKHSASVDKAMQLNGGGDYAPLANAKNKLKTRRTPAKKDPEKATVDQAVHRDGPPRMHGNKIAEVIVKLFSFSTHLISIGRTCNDIRNADSSGCERIVKVMYASTFEEKDRNKLGLKWVRDERTLTLSYPKQICVQILLVLVSSTLTMPVAHRVVDDFVVGFLRLD